MRAIINENEKGFLFRNGKYVKMLGAGSYHQMFGAIVESVSVEDGLHSAYCTLDTLLHDRTVAKQTKVIEVADEHLALHFVNGMFKEALRRGKYAFWNCYDRHEFRLVDISSPEVAADIPVYIFDKMPAYLFIKTEVAEYEKCRLYFNKKFVRLLDAGTYYFWKTNVSVETKIVDMRVTRMNVIGQEILTGDKVSVRINFSCNYRITDCIKIAAEIDDFKEQIHVAAQLALRDYVGRYRLDEILENKEKISEYVSNRLKEKEKKWYVEITDAGVKDIILPGEIREIMNTVLAAEKRAQANVITRREEVASTRSLLNTARLMDENRTLYKLKELEYMERICSNVGNITVNGNGDLLGQLAAILARPEKQQNGKLG